MKIRLNHQRLTKFSFVFFVLLLAGACGQKTAEEEPIVRPVRSIVVDSGDANSVKTFSGVSRSAQESKLSFKVAGTVKRIPVKVGDKIKAGTVIASLDSSTYDLQLQQSQATVEQSIATARNTRAAYQRTRELYANNNASLGDLDSARAASDSAAAQMRAARKSLQLSELSLSYTQLTVDVDCVVDSISVEVNENVSTNTDVARVNCSDELEVEVAVPESAIGSFSNGQDAKIQFDAISNVVFDGKVVEVGVGVSGAGSTFPVTVLVFGENRALRTGLAASVSFSLDRGDVDEYILPLSAIVKGVEGTFVYVVKAIPESERDDRGVVSKQRVILGELQTGGIEIIGGLAPGDRVVVAGVSFLREELVVSF